MLVQTFGKFSSYRGSQGGRGPEHVGHGRCGGYCKRGYGYNERGRGRAMPSRAQVVKLLGQWPPEHRSKPNVVSLFLFYNMFLLF